MRLALSFIVVVSALCAGCIPGFGTTQAECETSTCGCSAEKELTFTGYVMDGETHECVRGKLVRLRDVNGEVRAEDTSQSFGGYLVKGKVQRTPNCGGGEPVIRDMPEEGQQYPAYVWLPISTPIDDTSIKTNLLRFPFGTEDAGSGHPETCLPPRHDAGPGDAG